MTFRTLLTERAVVLAKIQTAIGVPATLDPNLDGILATDPDYSINPNVLERKFSRRDLSPFQFLIGRKLAMVKFTTEVRGNGHQNSGLLTDAPKLARLFQACGYQLIAMTGDLNNLGPVVPDSANPTGPDVKWTGGGMASGVLQPITYTITVGAADAYTLTNNLPTQDDGATHGSGTLASGTPILLGNSGLSIDPVFTGIIPAGSVFRVLVLPIGLKLKPLSENQPVISLQVFFDGNLHTVTDANGTFTIDAMAGGYAQITFDFTGQYHPTVVQDMPDAIYETTLPEQVELANLTWGSNNNLVVAQFTYDQKNTITPRPDVNGTDGYRGVRITARNPDGGLNPEATIESDEAFWDEFAKARAKHFVMQVGTVPGNIVVFHGPTVQTNSLGYGDRSGLRDYALKVMFKRFLGDDESFFYLV